MCCEKRRFGTESGHQGQTRTTILITIETQLDIRKRQLETSKLKSCDECLNPTTLPTILRNSSSSQSKHTSRSRNRWYLQSDGIPKFGNNSGNSGGHHLRNHPRNRIFTRLFDRRQSFACLDLAMISMGFLRSKTSSILLIPSTLFTLHRFRNTGRKTVVRNKNHRWLKRAR